MTLEELYYVSQIAAAVAIFGSLIFVTPLPPTSSGRGAGGEGGAPHTQAAETRFHSEQFPWPQLSRARTSFHVGVRGILTLTPNPSPARNGQERGDRCEIRA